jgi:hypothetical protein
MGTIFTHSDPAGRLGDARLCFERTIDHYDQWFRLVQKDLDFVHGRQWADADMTYLTSQGRPVLTFNVIHAKLNHMTGTLLDNLKVPKIVPTNTSHAARAEVLETIRKNVYEECDLDLLDLEVFERGMEAGVCTLTLDVGVDDRDPDSFEVVAYACNAFELLWDPGANRPDKRDASYNIWHRWMSVPQFRVEYPKAAPHLEAILGTSFSDWTSEYDRGGRSLGGLAQDGFYKPTRDTLYYDRRRHMVRVIRIEYQQEIKETVLVDTLGRRRAFPAQMAEQAMAAHPGAFAKEVRWRNETRWFEFIGNEMLYDDVCPLPVRRFSAIPFVVYCDDENYPYGKTRLLISPQEELNKRYSQTLNLVNQQVAPGVIAEEGAFIDDDQAEASLKTPGTTTFAKPGAVSGSKIMFRPTPTFPEAVARLAEFMLQLFDLIAGVHSDSFAEPRGIPEAAATTQLKHRQGLLSMNPVLKRFGGYQRNTAHTVLEIVLGVFSDDQLASLISRDEKFLVQNGNVVNTQTGEAVPIRDVRGLRHKIGLRPASENETERLMKLQSFFALLQLGTPVPPELVYENLGLSDEELERAKAFLKRTEQSAMQQQQMMMNLQVEQIQAEKLVSMIDRLVDAGKLQETVRSHMATEQLKGLELGVGSAQDVIALWSGADLEHKKMIAQAMIEKMKNETVAKGQAQKALPANAA